MMRITATEAPRQLSDLLNRAFYRGEDFELERNGQVVARLLPPRRVARMVDLEKLFALRSEDPSFADDLARTQEAMNVPLSPEDPWERQSTRRSSLPSSVATCLWSTCRGVPTRSR